MSRVSAPLSSAKIVNDTRASPSIRSSPIRPQSANTPIGVTNSSEAMTPESRAMARNGMLPLASACTRAVHARSYGARTSARYGGGDSGETCGRAHPEARKTATPTSALLLVVVNATVGLDEPLDPPLVEGREGLDAGP